jgi:hypothetical protein
MGQVAIGAFGPAFALLLVVVDARLTCTLLAINMRCTACGRELFNSFAEGGWNLLDALGFVRSALGNAQV